MAGSAVIPAMLPGQAKADTAVPATLYVNDMSTACSDKGAGTQAAPFCTIQAAADVVNPGQTVYIEVGLDALYSKPVTITRSGTAAAPITFAYEGLNNYTDLPYLSPGSVTGGAVVTLLGVHDVTISRLRIDSSGTEDGIDVIASSGIWLDQLRMTQDIDRAPTRRRRPSASTVARQTSPSHGRTSSARGARTRSRRCPARGR